MVSAVLSQTEIEVLYYLFFESYNKRDDNMCLAHPIEALKLFTLEKRKLEERKIINYKFNNLFTRSSLSIQFFRGCSAQMQRAYSYYTYIPNCAWGPTSLTPMLFKGQLHFFSFSNRINQIHQ